MNIFEQATRLKLRISTSKGLLSVEQVWSLSMTDLADAIKSHKQEVKKDDDLDFLTEVFSKVDEKTQLSFDILKSVYLTKKQENADAATKVAAKQHNAKIDALIAQKQEKELEGLSIEELKALKK